MKISLLAKSAVDDMLERIGRVVLSRQEYKRLKSFQPTAQRLREERILAHVATGGSPNINLVTRPAVDTPARPRIAERLLRAYKRAASEEPLTPMRRNASDLWTELVRKEFDELIKIIETEDVGSLSRFLMNFGKGYSWFGGLTFSVDGYNKRNRDEQAVALSYYDKLICLAEAAGVLPVEHPEHGRWGENLHADIANVIDELEKELNISIAPPLGVVPVSGVDTKKGVFHYRHINGIYVAWRMRSLVPPESGICEYGGGNGIAAYYAWRIGLRNYTIFDLPIVNLFAGHFLLNALGEEAVTLYGEDPRPETIALKPYWKCLDCGQRAFFLAMNQDSFPEIDAGLVMQYLSAISNTTERYFLSINQESQGAMAETRQLNIPLLVKLSGHYRRLYRFRYWVREGYVEELYEIHGEELEARG
jgi:hypothetical protein